MNKYDPDKRCSKCGAMATARYMDGRKSSIVDEMKRECVLCGYFWFEHPLDYKAPEATDETE